MPFVKRKRDEEQLIPGWLRKVFGLGARNPEPVVPDEMPEPVDIPARAPRPAPWERYDLLARTAGREPPPMPLAVQDDITVHKPLAFKARA